MGYKTIEDIGKEWEDGKYEVKRPFRKKVSLNHVFDEDMSVKWNRDEETITAITREGFSIKQAKIIEAQVENKDHAPYSNYFIDLYDEMEYVSKVMSAK